MYESEVKVCNIYKRFSSPQKLKEPDSILQRINEDLNIKNLEPSVDSLFLFLFPKVWTVPPAARDGTAVPSSEMRAGHRVWDGGRTYVSFPLYSQQYVREYSWSDILSYSG